MSAVRCPALFVVHGSADASEITTAWKKHAADYYTGDGKRPSAIVVISAHYESSRIVKVGGAAHPVTMNDYPGGRFQYPAPGNPELSERIVKRLQDAGIAAEVDPRRGLDHAIYLPLRQMFPEADIPVIPMSVLRSQIPSEHIAIGRALSSLRDENVLFLGSGFSTHNFSSRGRKLGFKFHETLTKVISDKKLTREDRAKALDRYLEWPGVEEAQQKGAAEHLMPLFTVLGTAGGQEWGTEVAQTEMEPPFGSLSWHTRHYLFDAVEPSSQNEADCDA